MSEKLSIFKQDTQTSLLRHDRLGIDEIDIQNETDVPTLMYWKVEIQGDISKIDGQIENFRLLRGRRQPTEGEARWLCSAKGARRIMKQLVQRIHARLAKLKQERKQANIAAEQAKREYRHNLFMQVCKERLPAEQWAQIWREVENRSLIMGAAA